MFSTKTPFLLVDGEAIPMLHNTNLHEEKSGLIDENMRPVGPFENGKSNIIIDLDFRKIDICVCLCTST